MKHFTSSSRSVSIAAASSNRTGNSAPTAGYGWLRTAQAAATRCPRPVRMSAPGVAWPYHRYSPEGCPTRGVSSSRHTVTSGRTTAPLCGVLSPPKRLSRSRILPLWGDRYKTGAGREHRGSQQHTALLHRLPCAGDGIRENLDTRSHRVAASQ